MHEVNQRFGIPSQLDGHRDRFLERVEELIRVPDLPPNRPGHDTHEFDDADRDVCERPDFPRSLAVHRPRGRGERHNARHHQYLTIPRRVRWSWESSAT